MVDGGGQVDNEYGMSLGGCVAGNSSESMAQAYPDVPTEEDLKLKKAPNKANLESTQSSLPRKVESGLTGPAGRKQSQSRDETEIQRREERPAAFRKKHKKNHKPKLSQPETGLTARVQGVSFRPGGLSIFAWRVGKRLAQKRKSKMKSKIRKRTKSKSRSKRWSRPSSVRWASA